MGGFYTTPQDFLNQDESPRGIMYTEGFYVAVSAALAVELLIQSPLLRAIAVAPGSCFKLYLSERKSCKFFKRSVKTTPQILKRVYVLATQAAHHNVEQEYRELYMSPQSVLLKLMQRSALSAQDGEAVEVLQGRPVGCIS